MKSARERAEDHWAALPMGAACMLDRSGWTAELERSFKEHARDTLDAAGSRLMAAVRGSTHTNAKEEG